MRHARLGTISMSKWQKNYGIDENGRRCIVITENAKPTTLGDRVVGMFMHALLVLMGIIFVLMIVMMALESAQASVVGFLGTHRWIVVLGIVIVAMLFLGKVSHRLHPDGNANASSSDRTSR